MSRFLPSPASAHAADIDVVITLIHWLMAALLMGWGAYFVWVLVRFRRSRQPKADSAGARGRFAVWIEAGVVAAEAVILIVVALPVWYARTSPADPPSGAMAVRVVAEQFTWNVHYPGRDGRFGTTSIALITSDNPLGLDRRSDGGADDVIVQNQLHVPINRPLLISLSSKDVVHSFGVPAMRVKQDAIPGVQTRISFTPTVGGVFDIACSQLCGLAHFRMRGRITVESDAEFERFLADEAAAVQ